ncbi:hypothetical protein [Bradyrhizobium manausense]|uniref:hypothetical protein n=1 Tax=Bradyrhizobium manausense TaxID=989370 RepID=UPI0032E047A8
MAAKLPTVELVVSIVSIRISPMLDLCLHAIEAFRRLRSDNGGVVSFEYVIVAACIVGAVAAAFGTGAGGGIATALGTAINSITTAITTAVGA